MAKNKPAKKKPSRVAYEKEHPTVSFRLNKETKARLDKHLEAAGCSFADFVKDNLGREENMVEERVARLTSMEVEKRQAPELDLELYKLVLDLAKWNVVLWMNLPNPLKVTCPDCFFPSKLTGKEGKVVEMEMSVTGQGDFVCPECGLKVKNPLQLAWIALVRTVAEEHRREMLLKSQAKGTDEVTNKAESLS
jgi:hypothetical protein